MNTSLFKDLIYEQDLPDNITDEQYSEWHKKSHIVDGVRMGYPLQQENRETIITTEQLLESGWVETTDTAFPLERNLTAKDDEDYDPDDGELKMVVHRMYNTPVIALLLPDGGLLNLAVSTIEELNSFIEKIGSYDPPY